MQRERNILITIIAKKEFIDEIQDAIGTVVVATSKEFGNISCQWRKDTANLAKFMILEKWDSCLASDMHSESAHFLHFKQMIKEKIIILTTDLVWEVY